MFVIPLSSYLVRQYGAQVMNGLPKKASPNRTFSLPDRCEWRLVGIFRSFPSGTLDSLERVFQIHLWRVDQMGHSGKEAWNLKFFVYVFIYPCPSLPSMFSTELVLLYVWCPLVLSPLWNDYCRLTTEHREAGNQCCFNSVSWELCS